MSLRTVQSSSDSFPSDDTFLDGNVLTIATGLAERNSYGIESSMQW